MANKTKVSPQKEAAIRADEDKKIEGAARIKRIFNHGSGFMNFIREQGVIGLAVGLAIGSAAGASVKTIVDQLISPIVALLTQGVNLNNLKWVIEPKTAVHPEVAVGWGAIMSSLITLLATALVIYFIIHYAKLDRLDKKKQ